MCDFFIKGKKFLSLRMDFALVKRFLWIFLLAAVTNAPASFSQAIPAALGNYAGVLDKLELENYDGRKLPLAGYKNHALTVYLLLAHDCPVCQKYGATFRQLSGRYSGASLQVIGIAPADGATAENIGEFARSYQFDFPILLDSQKIFTHVFKAKITPEVFLVDRSGNLLYRGMVDNWFYELGKYRNVVTENYLHDAIIAALAGEHVDPNRTEPIGCLLNMSMHH